MAKRLVTGVIYRLKMLSPDPRVRANKGQLLYGYLPEADFELFGLLDREDGLVIDAGANRGHCAIAVLLQTKQLYVHSFEPNPAMRNALAYLKNRFPSRFDYHLCGLGCDEQTRELHIPVSRKQDVSANASFRSSEFKKDYVRERLEKETGKEFHAVAFTHDPARLLPLDSFGLAPIAIKIDVEGMEKDVLEGARKTIKEHRPMLMIEMNNHEEFVPILEAMDYHFYRYAADSKTLEKLADQSNCLNIICLHSKSPAYDTLSQLIS